MAASNLYAKQMTRHFGSLEQPLVCLFNTDRISEQEVDQLIADGQADSSQKCIVITYEQYLNLMDVPVTDENAKG